MVMARRKDPVEEVCHFCRQTIKDSPYRTPMVGTVGGRFQVCGPLCPERPEGVLVFQDWRVK